MFVENVRIRLVQDHEIGILSTIGSHTFIDTYGEFNTEENMKNYLSENFSEDAIKVQVKNPNTFLYFAEMDHSIVGYIKLNKGDAQTDSKLENALEIERIYVVKEFQGNRIGNTLFQQAIATAKSLGLLTIWLGVWDRNVKAIEFYKKNGFIEFDKHLFMLGTDPQSDTLMKFDLI